MKAICIIGSPRPRGSTTFLVDRVIEGMKTEGIEVQRFILGQLRINYCQGCKHCEVSRKCIQRDDMDQLLAGILESDIVLLASPSYWGDITGQMKIFIDRSLPLCNAKTGETPVPKGKMGVAVAVRAGPSKGENQHIIDTFAHYFGHLGIKLVGQLTVESVDALSDIMGKQDILKVAFQLGTSLPEIR